MTDNKKHLRALPTVIFILGITAFSALTAWGFGGISSLGVCTAAFAFLLLASKSPLIWISVPLSFGMSFLISGDWVSALSTLMFVPSGLLLYFLISKKKNLSVTVVVLTVVMIISMAAYLTLAVTQIYGLGIKESYIALGADVENAMYDLFEVFSYEDPNGKEIFSLSSEDIKKLLQTMTMLAPGIAIASCELTAYASAKLCRLFAYLFGFNCAFEKNNFHTTLSAPAGAIYIVSYAISFLSTGESVVAYSALNLTYMIMPLAAIAGFHYIFGKNGFLRSGVPKGSKIIFIITCGLCLFMYPLSAPPLLATLGSMGAVGKGVRAYIKQKREKDQNSDLQ